MSGQERDTLRELAAFLEKHGGPEARDAFLARMGTPTTTPKRSSMAQRRAADRRLEAAGEPTNAPRVPFRRCREREVPQDTPRRRRFLAELARRGARQCAPRELATRLWRCTASIMRGGRGRVAEHVGDWLATLPPEYSRRVRRAATADGTRSLAHIVARETVAIAWVWFVLAEPTRRRGFAAVLGGVPRGTVAALLTNAQTGEPYSVSYLYATSWGNDRAGFYDCGPAVALRRVGAVYVEQPPADTMPRAWVGPSGYAFALVWIPERCVAAAPAPS